MQDYLYVYLCVSRGSSNKSFGFVASTIAALFEHGPSSVPSASCNRNSSSSLLSTQPLFARNLFSSAAWICAHMCIMDKGNDAFFVPFILGRRGAKGRTHTPPTLHSDDLACTQTQMSQGGDLFEEPSDKYRWL